MKLFFLNYFFLAIVYVDSGYLSLTKTFFSVRNALLDETGQHHPFVNDYNFSNRHLLTSTQKEAVKIL